MNGKMGLDGDDKMKKIWKLTVEEKGAREEEEEIEEEEEEEEEQVGRKCVVSMRSKRKSEVNSRENIV